MNRRKKQITFTLAGAMLSLLLFAFFLEAAARLAGYAPWSDFRKFDKEPIVYEPDPERGWRIKPGHYVFPPYAPGAPAITMTFDFDGSRTTGEKITERRKDRRIFFIGGSFTMGWAISDDATLAWRIQETFPDATVRNYGVGGYGTLQTYLTLEKIKKGIRPGDVVFYGLIEHHIDRNVAPAYWLEVLARYSHRGHVALPWAALDKETGELILHKPESYPRVLLRERSAAVTVLTKAYMLLKTADRTRDKREILEKLILKMNTLVKSQGGRFLVIFFAGGEDFLKKEAAFLKTNGIGMVNCAFKQTPELTVRGETHPNEKMNLLWSKEVADILEKLGFNRKTDERPVPTAKEQ